MRFILFFYVIFAGASGAFESYAVYKTGYGIFTLGEAKASLIVEKDRYRSSVEAVATGVAALLTNGRKEIYLSEGRVVDGRLVPDLFTTKFITKNRKKIKEHYINHSDGLVSQRIEDCKGGECSLEFELLDPKRYAKDDILTLYHNAQLDLVISNGADLLKSAIGSKRPVEIAIAKDSRLKTAKKLFGDSDGEFLVVTLNQEIFSSKKGELYIDMGKDRITKKAVLRKTMLFGDVWGELMSKRIVE